MRLLLVGAVAAVAIDEEDGGVTAGATITDEHMQSISGAKVACGFQVRDAQAQNQMSG